MPRAARLMLGFVLLLPACQFGISGHGNVSERHGVLHLDEVALPHHRELRLGGGVDALLVLATHTGPIDIQGVPGAAAELVVDVYSEFEGDGEVSWSGGEPVVASQRAGRVLINGIRGTVPAGVDLRLVSGTGRIVARALDGAAKVHVASGTGAVFVQECRVEELGIDTGTGDARLDGLVATVLRMQSGTGTLVAERCRVARGVGESGTGDFRFTACTLDDLAVTSGTGGLWLTDSPVARLSSSLGTGQVHIEQGSLR